METHQCQNFICGWALNYKNIDDDLKVDWKNDVIFYFKKAIALLKRRNTQFEKERLGLNLYRDSIITLNMPNDTFFRKNKLYKARNRTISPLYLYKKPSWNPEFLLAGLRALSSHGTQENINEDDAKISLYLALKLFAPEANLKKLASKMFFDVLPTDEKLLTPDFFTKINSSLLNELGLQNEPGKLEIGRYTINWKKDKIEISFPGQNWEMVTTSQRMSDFPKTLNYPSAASPVFQRLNFKKQNHYLLFLSRLSSKISCLKDDDYYLVSKISEKCGISLSDKG